MVGREHHQLGHVEPESGRTAASTIPLDARQLRDQRLHAAQGMIGFVRPRQLVLHQQLGRRTGGAFDGRP